MKNVMHAQFRNKTKEKLAEIGNPILLEQFFVRDDYDKNGGCMVDLTHRCPLECPMCKRQMEWKDQGQPVPGRDLPMSTIEKVLDTWKLVSFGGQLSDPMHHPKFVEILEMCNKKGVRPTIHVASSAKPKSYFIKCFEAAPKARWKFGIDGMPEDSHLYRINQDGVKLFDIMCEARNILTDHKPIWQYIIFKYNEKDIDKAIQKAKDNNIDLILMKSSRWYGMAEKYMPSEEHRIETVL
jgi:MoaA/NifB/PqqE/SkfB family radical SAM enzyme